MLTVAGMLVLPRMVSSIAGVLFHFLGLVLKAECSVFCFSFRCKTEWEVNVHVCVWVNYCMKKPTVCALSSLASYRAKVCVFYAMQTTRVGIPLVDIVNFFQHASDDYAQTFFCYASLAGFDFGMRSWCVPFFRNTWMSFRGRLVDSLGYSLSLSLPKASWLSPRYYWCFVFQVEVNLLVKCSSVMQTEGTWFCSA